MNEKTESPSRGSIPSLAYLREAFSYDPNTGKVFWKDRPLSHFSSLRGKKRADNNIGKEAGTAFKHSHHDSFCGLKTCILYNGKPANVLMHHVAWRLTYGDIPAGLVIDHRNNDPCDNRIENLRLANQSQNAANARNRKRVNGLPRGVHLEKSTGKFIAKVGINYRREQIGRFDTPEEAHQAFLKRSEELHGEYCKHLTGEGEAGV